MKLDEASPTLRGLMKITFDVDDGYEDNIS